MKKTKVLVTFSAEAIRKIKKVQNKLYVCGSPHSKSAAANHIIENDYRDVNTK